MRDCDVRIHSHHHMYIHVAFIRDEDREMNEWQTFDSTEKKAYRVEREIGCSIIHLRLRKYTAMKVFEYFICDLYLSMATIFELDIRWELKAYRSYIIFCFKFSPIFF